MPDPERMPDHPAARVPDPRGRPLALRSGRLAVRGRRDDRDGRGAGRRERDDGRVERRADERVERGVVRDVRQRRRGVARERERLAVRDAREAAERGGGGRLARGGRAVRGRGGEGRARVVAARGGVPVPVPVRAGVDGLDDRLRVGPVVRLDGGGLGGGGRGEGGGRGGERLQVGSFGWGGGTSCGIAAGAGGGRTCPCICEDDQEARVVSPLYLEPPVHVLPIDEGRLTPPPGVSTPTRTHQRRWAAHLDVPGLQLGGKARQGQDASD